MKPTCLSPPVFMKTPGGCAPKSGVLAKLFSVPGVHSVSSDDKQVHVQVWNEASVHAVRKLIVDEFTPFVVGTAPPMQYEDQFESGNSYGDRCRFDHTFCQDRSATCAFVVEHEGTKYAATARHAVFLQGADAAADDRFVHSPSPAIDQVTPPVVVANSFEVFQPLGLDFPPPGDFAMFRLSDGVAVPAQFGRSVQEVVDTAVAALKPGTVLRRVGAVTGVGNATVIRCVFSALPPMASPPAFRGHLVSLEVGSAKGDSGGPYITTDTNTPAAVHKASVTAEQVVAAFPRLPTPEGDHLAIVESCEVLDFFEMPDSRVL